MLPCWNYNFTHTKKNYCRWMFIKCIYTHISYQANKMCSEILTAARRAWSRSAIIFSSSSRPTDKRMSVSLMPNSFFSFSGTETWVILTLEKKSCTMGNWGGWNVISNYFYLIFFIFSPINHYDMTRYCIKLVKRNNRICELLVNHKYHKQCFKR